MIVDRYFLTRDQGALVAGLLEGHIKCCAVSTWLATFGHAREHPEPLFRNLACNPRGISEPDNAMTISFIPSRPEIARAPT